MKLADRGDGKNLDNRDITDGQILFGAVASDDATSIFSIIHHHSFIKFLKIVKKFRDSYYILK